LRRDLYANSKTATYVGFRKNHPHDSTSFIRIAYVSEFTNLDDIRDDVSAACDAAIKIYSDILTEFEK